MLTCTRRQACFKEYWYKLVDESVSSQTEQAPVAARAVPSPAGPLASQSHHHGAGSVPDSAGSSPACAVAPLKHHRIQPERGRPPRMPYSAALLPLQSALPATKNGGVGIGGASPQTSHPDFTSLPVAGITSAAVPLFFKQKANAGHNS